MSICIGMNTLVAVLATVVVGEVTSESIKTYISLGAEYGNDFKFYTEYLSTIENFDNGRFSAGLKVIFK